MTFGQALLVRVFIFGMLGFVITMMLPSNWNLKKTLLVLFPIALALSILIKIVFGF